MSKADDRNSSLSASAAEERPRPRNQRSSKKNAYALKYNIGQRLRLCGTKTSVMVMERHLPGSSHHDPSLINREEEVTNCTIRPCDSVCPDYFVKLSKNKIFKVSEGRLCYLALYICLATVCTDFPFLRYNRPEEVQWAKRCLPFSSLPLPLTLCSIVLTYNSTTAQIAGQQSFSRRVIFPFQILLLVFLLICSYFMFIPYCFRRPPRSGFYLPVGESFK